MCPKDASTLKFNQAKSAVYPVLNLSSNATLRVSTSTSFPSAGSVRVGLALPGAAREDSRSKDGVDAKGGQMH